MDKKIISNLKVYNYFIKNPNMTMKEIGKHFGISFQVASYKITKILKERKI